MRYLRKYWLLISLFLLAFCARILPGPRIVDDAYITFRYARNIFAGYGFVYNLGQRVLGTTTPLYTIALSSLAIFCGGEFADFPTLAWVLNSLLDGFTCVLLLLIGKKLKLHWAGLGAALAWSIAPWSVTFAIGGLETSLYVILLVAAWASYLYQRYPATALAASLALLTRPDALALVLPLVFDRLLLDPKRRGQKTRMIEVISFTLPLLIWFSFAFYYFGRLLPHSITAKAIAYNLDPFTALIRFLQHYATPFMEHTTLGNGVIKIGVILYPALFLLGALRLYKNGKQNWPFLLFPLGYTAAFAWANPLVFRWYLTPPLPFYFIGLLAGLEFLLNDLAASFRKKRISSAITALAVAALPFFSLLNNWQWQPDHGVKHPAPEMAWYKLELLYIDVAKELTPEIRNRHAMLAAGDVGALGYFTDAYILDTVGLMSPESLDYYPLPAGYYKQFIYAIPPELIYDLQPDYLVTLEIYVRSGLMQQPRFQQLYQLKEKIPTDIYGSDGLLVFEKR